MPQEGLRLNDYLTKLRQERRSTPITDFPAQRAANTFSGAHSWSKATTTRHVLAGRADTVSPAV